MSQRNVVKHLPFDSRRGSLLAHFCLSKRAQQGCPKISRSKSMTTHEFDRPTVDYKLLRASAALLFGGIVVSIVAGVLHPSHEIPNDHTAVFAEYASSSSWTAVHLGQFVGMAIMIAGLLTLFFAFNVRSGLAGWSGRLGAVAASAALALYGVLQAVDGVALKQAVDAWASAPEAEKAARFAAAETVRWLEWGSRSYQSFTLGLALLLFAVMIVSTARVPRLIGYLMALTGIAYLVQGWAHVTRSLHACCRASIDAGLVCVGGLRHFDATRSRQPSRRDTARPLSNTWLGSARNIEQSNRGYH
jgi:uncharacterized membrane protein HdeD (DUF308 family)